MTTEDKKQETKENKKSIKETKQTGLEDLSSDELEDLKVILKQRKEEKEKIENKKKDIVQLLDELSYDQLIKAEVDIGLIKYKDSKKVDSKPEKEDLTELVEEKRVDRSIKEKKVVPPEKDKTSLGVVCGLFLSIIFGWILGLALYPEGSDERKTYFRGYEIALFSSLIVGIILFPIIYLCIVL